MTYTSTPPTEPGYYHAKWKTISASTIVELEIAGTWLDVYVIGSGDAWTPDYFLWGPRIEEPKG